MAGKLTKSQVEKVQIDYGIVYLNYGEDGERKLAPTRGGAEFTVEKNIREIEYDGRMGKTKGMQVVDEINAVLKFSLMSMSQENIELGQPWAGEDAGIISNTAGGIIPDNKYVANVTMFARTADGQYKKITLFNAMNEADFTITAGPKAEGVVAYEVYAHWDPETMGAIYEIEDVNSISGDDTPPTVTTVPANSASGVAVGDSLTATFNEAVMPNDINLSNFILAKVGGSIVAGTLTYDAGNKRATFVPSGDLDTSSDYIWTIARVRDTNGNAMVPVAVNFATA